MRRSPTAGPDEEASRNWRVERGELERRFGSDDASNGETARVMGRLERAIRAVAGSGSRRSSAGERNPVPIVGERAVRRTRATPFTEREAFGLTSDRRERGSFYTKFCRGPPSAARGSKGALRLSSSRESEALSNDRAKFSSTSCRPCRRPYRPCRPCRRRGRRASPRRRRCPRRRGRRRR